VEKGQENERKTVIKKEIPGGLEVFNSTIKQPLRSEAKKKKTEGRRLAHRRPLLQKHGRGGRRGTERQKQGTESRKILPYQSARSRHLTE